MRDESRSPIIRKLENAIKDVENEGFHHSIAHLYVYRAFVKPGGFRKPRRELVKDALEMIQKSFDRARMMREESEPEQVN